MSRVTWLPLLAVTLLASACGDTASLPDTPARAVPHSGIAAGLSPCTSDPAVIQAALSSGFTSLASTFTATSTWNAIVQATNANNPTLAKAKAFELVDFLLLQDSLHLVAHSPAALATLMNQVFCYVGIDAGIANPRETWVVHVGDPITTLMTQNVQSGAQFPPDAVVENTVVTVKRVTDLNALTTPLDKYPFIYEWTVSPAQTLKPGTKAIIGVCPNPAELTNVPASELDALLARLVLGHQKDASTFEVLPRVDLPPEMALACGAVTSAAMPSTWGGRALTTLASMILPAPLSAARRLAGGGIGGATSEFSPFEPVDPQLFASGGVGGSTSEFVRDALLVTTIDGTVGTTRGGSGLPSVTVKTRLGTPIPGVIAAWNAAPSTVAPYSAKPGNATVCGADAATNAAGTAAVSCLNFGTTSALRTAYTKLTVALTPPADLDPDVIEFVPDAPGWLIATYGASNLVFTQPAAGSYSAGALIPARVEVRSDLGTIVPTASTPVTLSLNKNSFDGGGTTKVANTVNGVATFSTTILQSATGYRFAATATLGDAGVVTSTTGSNLFDVLPGTALRFVAVGPTAYDKVNDGPVSPTPTVRVTDQFNNPQIGVPVFWTPGGAMGATVNGAPSTTTTLTGADGSASVAWVPGEGDNQLRASLQAAPGGAEVFYTATHAADFTTINACNPAASRDDIAAYYVTIPGPVGGSGLVHSIGLYLSAEESPGQTGPIAYPMTLVAERVVKNATTGAPQTQSFSASAVAFLGGDTDAVSGIDRLVTFQFAIGPLPNAQLVTRNRQPELVLRFQLPSGGYGRRINFNGGPCAPGRNCSPPPGCSATQSALPFPSASLFRKSVAIIVRGRFTTDEEDRRLGRAR
ncbi:MAG: Ig-like domain-containing protein [Gemmatimonadales bacterium]